MTLSQGEVGRRGQARCLLGVSRRDGETEEIENATHLAGRVLSTLLSCQRKRPTQGYFPIRGREFAQQLRATLYSLIARADEEALGSGVFTSHRDQSSIGEFNSPIRDGMSSKGCRQRTFHQSAFRVA